jgi:hypothetical protein
MRAAVVPTLLALGVLLFTPMIGSAHDDSLMKLVLSEHPRAITELKLRFERTSGSVRVEHTARRRSGGTPEKFLASFDLMAARAARVRLLPEAGPNAGAAIVICRNSEYSFVLRRPMGAGEYAIRDLSAAADAQRIDGAISRYLARGLEAPYRMDWIQLSAAYDTPGFSLRSVSRSSENGSGLLKLAFYLPTPTIKSSGGGQEGWLLVSPQEKWALRAYEFHPLSGTAVVAGTVEYGERQNGFPTPMRVVGSVRDTSKNAVTEAWTYDFEHFRFGDSPEREFTLTAFGLPEGAARPSRVARSQGLGYWFLGSAAAALAIAVGLRIASSRLERASGR